MKCKKEIYIMNLISDYQEYRELYKEFHTTGTSYETNLFLFPKEIQHIIDEARLYYMIENNIFYLLADEGHHYHMYYYWDLTHTPILPTLDKPILIEIIYNEKVKHEHISLIGNNLINAGAIYRKKSYQIEINNTERNNLLKAEYLVLQHKLTNNQMQIVYAQHEDVPAIRYLWDEYLDPFDFNDISEMTLKKMLNEKQILIIKDNRNKIIASKCMTLSKKRSLGFHLVVSPEARGLSLGKTLMCEWLKISDQQGIAFCNAWIAENNRISMNCHLKGGYKTGKISEQYIIPTNDKMKRSCSTPQQML